MSKITMQCFESFRGGKCPTWLHTW